MKGAVRVGMPIRAALETAVVGGRGGGRRQVLTAAAKLRFSAASAAPCTWAGLLPMSGVQSVTEVRVGHTVRDRGVAGDPKLGCAGARSAGAGIDVAGFHSVRASWGGRTLLTASLGKSLHMLMGAETHGRCVCGEKVPNLFCAKLSCVPAQRQHQLSL